VFDSPLTLHSLVAQLAGTSLGLSISGAIFQNLSVPRVAEIVGPDFSLEQVTRIVSRIDPVLIASLPENVYKQAQEIVVDAIANGYAPTCFIPDKLRETKQRRLIVLCSYTPVVHCALFVVSS